MYLLTYKCKLLIQNETETGYLKKSTTVSMLFIYYLVFVWNYNTNRNNM